MPSNQGDKGQIFAALASLTAIVFDNSKFLGYNSNSCAKMTPRPLPETLWQRHNIWRFRSAMKCFKRLCNFACLPKKAGTWTIKAILGHCRYFEVFDSSVVVGSYLLRNNVFKFRQTSFNPPGTKLGDSVNFAYGKFAKFRNSVHH